MRKMKQIVLVSDGKARGQNLGLENVFPRFSNLVKKNNFSLIIGLGGDVSTQYLLAQKLKK